jgi:hypothetical protein
METVSTSEMLVSFYETTHRNVRERSYNHIGRCENLKNLTNNNKWGILLNLQAGFTTVMYFRFHDKIVLYQLSVYNLFNDAVGSPDYWR